MPPYGRGGAGNILISTQLDEANARLEHDLEANQQNLQLRPEDVMDRGSRPTQEYASSGRGGAGNMVTPKALKAATDTSTAPTPSSHPPSPPPPTPAVSTTPKAAAPPIGMAAGRGGAGNMMHATQVQQQREAVRRQREEEQGEVVRERVRQDVEMGLRAPGRAVLGGEKAGRGW